MLDSNAVFQDQRSRNMDQMELEGVRLLSFDGGDIRAVSQLVILDEFMRRVEWDTKAPSRIPPCKYFHMIAGVGTGGIIVFLLVVLGMGTEEAIEQFLFIWQTVYADEAMDKATRFRKLEDVLRTLMHGKSIQENQILSPWCSQESGCKAFVCAVPDSNLGLCEKFRNYRSKETSMTPTTIEAIRSTCSIPTLFTSVTIESVGCTISYTTGAYNFNNPAGELIREACEHFGKDTGVLCMLSLGCGSPSALHITQKSDHRSITDHIASIASDSELVHRDLAWRLGRSGVYYRVSASQHLETSGETSHISIEAVLAGTRKYLENPDTLEKVNQVAEASDHLGRTTLRHISGLSEHQQAPAHGLPFLSASFVQRPALIKDMAKSLFQNGTGAQRRIVISGLGGIGKTQITISFLLQFLARFRHVLFVDGSSVQALESGVVAKIKSLGSAYSPTTAKEALDILARADHEITRDWAIVYDNVDDPAVKIARYFPLCPFGTIFITTRNPNLGDLAPNAHLRLDVMSEDEAVEVLLRSAIPLPRVPTEGDRNHARQIAKDLGYLPVALVQAGYFIRLHDCMDDYSQRLQRLRPSVLGRPAEYQVDNHYHGVYATLEVTWPYLSPRAQNFMSVLGFVNYTGFPLILISRAARHGFLFEPCMLVDRPDMFHQTVQLLRRTFIPREEPDQQDVDDLVAELEGYSLIIRMSTFMVKALRLHPLVHSWVHDRLSDPEKEAYRSAATRLLVCGTANSDEDIFEFIYPHITSWSDRLGALHLNDLAGFARVFMHQGDHPTGVALWEHICKDISELYGTDDIRTSEAKLQLAGTYWKSRINPEIAAGMERDVVELRMRTLGPADTRTVTALTQQARGMAREWDKREESVSILRNVIKFWQAREPSNDWESLLEAREWLASVLFGWPDPLLASEVIRLSTEVLQARMEQSGPDHYATLRATETLAVAYGEYAGYPWWKDINTTGNSSVNLWNFVVKARTERRGIRHPDTLDAMERLAWAYYPQREYKTFVARWGEVFILRRDVQGTTHEKTISMMARLVRTRASRWNGTEAELAIQKGVIFMMKEVHGPPHDDTIEFMNNLAEDYERWGKYDEAIAQRGEALALLKQVQGSGRHKPLDCMKLLSRACRMCGRDMEAIARWKDFITWVKEIHGCTTEYTVDAMKTFAVDCVHWKQYEEAIFQWKAILALQKEKDRIHHPSTLYIMQRLAKTYFKSGKHSEAITQWKDFIAQIKELHGCAGESAIKVMEIFASDCVCWKHYEEAIVQRKDILSLQMRRAHHGDTLNSIDSLARTYAMCGQYSEAITQWKVFISQIKELRSCAQKGTIQAMEMFARDCEHRKQYEQAIVQRKGILASWQEKRGIYHRDTLRCMWSLARTYVACRRSSDAITEWKEFISQTEKLCGRAHNATVGSMETMAYFCEGIDQYEEALTQRRMGLALRMEVVGPHHRDSLKALEGLVKAYRGLDRNEDLLWQIGGPSARVDHHNPHRHIAGLAQAYGKAGLYDEPEAQSEEVIALGEDMWGEREVRHVIQDLAGIYAKMGQEEEAKPFLDYAEREAVTGPGLLKLLRV